MKGNLGLLEEITSRGWMVAILPGRVELTRLGMLPREFRNLKEAVVFVRFRPRKVVQA